MQSIISLCNTVHPAVRPDVCGTVSYNAAKTLTALLCCSNLTDTLFILFLYNNNFEGDLSMVSGSNLGVVSTADNPNLCGMVPASVRWAHGYNPHNTSLGMACM